MACKITGESPCRCGHGRAKGMVLVSYEDLKAAMRKVWSEHSWYTVLTIFESVPVEQPDANIVITRLLRNPTDIKNLIQPFVGEAKATSVETVVANHLKLAAAALGALRSRNQVNITTAVNEFYAQGDLFASALHDLNPVKLPLDTTKAMIHQHNEYVVKIASARQGSKFEEEISTIDPYQKHMMMLADVITDALPRT